MKRILPYILYLWHITAGFHRTVILRTFLGVFRIGVVLSFIWLSKTAIDCATGRIAADDGRLIWLFVFMVVCLLVDVTLSQWVKYIELRATMLMNNRVSRRMFNILMALPLVNGQQGFHSGDMLNRLTLDVRTVSSFALSQLPAMVVMLVQLIASFVFLAWLNPYLALAPVVIMPVCLLASRLYFRRHRRLTAAIRNDESKMQISMQEGLQHRIVLKSLECIDEMDGRLSTILQRLDMSNREQSRLSTVNGAMVRLGFIIGYLTAFGWSIFSLRVGVITFGTMSAFIQLVSRIQHPIAGLAGYLPSFISTWVAVDRLREIDVKVPVDDGGAECSPLVSPGVIVKDVSFRYRADGNDVLSCFSHNFKPGSRTMIVGPTGVGKSTLIKLLLGLLKPDEGHINIYNNVTSCAVSSSTLCNFAYVPQGNSLLNGSIRENLLLACPQATDEQLLEVLHVAAADFVFDLPLGLDTSCDEAGGGLSEGRPSV